MRMLPLDESYDPEFHNGTLKKRVVKAEIPVGLAVSDDEGERAVSEDLPRQRAKEEDYAEGSDAGVRTEHSRRGPGADGAVGSVASMSSVSFYGPVYSDREAPEEAELPEEPVVVDEKPRAIETDYVYVKDSHAPKPGKKKQRKGEERLYEWAETGGLEDFSNKVRWYLLTEQESKKQRTLLHRAALNGDKDFCTMLVKEAEKMGHIDDIINQKDADGLTPLYLLCEKGYAKDKDEGYEDSEEEDAAVGGAVPAVESVRSPGLPS